MANAKCRGYEPIASLFISERMPLSTSVSSRARRDYCEELYNSCMSGDRAAKQRFSSLHATWFGVLQAVVKCTDAGQVTKEQWVGALAASMASNGIECVLGLHRSRITCRRAVRLVEHSPSVLALQARPGSLKRAAIEAECRVDRPAKRRVIDFGCEVPFTRIPGIIEDGFQLQERNFKRGDQRVLEHYEVARHCLEECLGDPLCDLLLMIALTFASSSVTPEVAPNSKGFGAAAKRKDPALLAVNLVTRMLWFLRPQRFPRDADCGSVLRVSEMTKKIGKTQTAVRVYG